MADYYAICLFKHQRSFHAIHEAQFNLKDIDPDRDLVDRNEKFNR